MRAEDLEPDVRDLLDQARDTLGSIEMHVREAGEDASLMEASRRYARLCMALREYLSSLQQRRPRPRRLADELDATAAALAPLQPRFQSIQARPSPDELATVAAKARSVPQA